MSEKRISLKVLHDMTGEERGREYELIWNFHIKITNLLKVVAKIGINE